MHRHFRILYYLIFLYKLYKKIETLLHDIHDKTNLYTHTTMLVLVFDTETNGLPKNMKSIPNGDNFNDL